jgi:hypothetical protein
MIRGTDVTLTSRAVASRDEMGEPVFAVTTTTVGNVLWHEASTEDIDESNRMFGVTCDLSLDFPKAYTGSLEGAVVEVRGKSYRILGDPAGYMPENTPTPWNRRALAVRSDG